ncbi:MAG: DUF1289 domain-containing protein [Rhodopirellula sp.]|nr:DUF1289 domain-containing protein [Rhodopirellula sp.]OUX50730.1 MAG: hypothetical protein CBE43_05645 [Rhodopirellula sp. TMED283]
MNDSPKRIVSSRCVGVCALNSDGTCIGCHRNLEEISQWANASADDREKINRVAATREQQMKRHSA